MDWNAALRRDVVELRLVGAREPYRTLYPNSSAAGVTLESRGLVVSKRMHLSIALIGSVMPGSLISDFAVWAFESDKRRGVALGLYYSYKRMN